MSDFRTSARGEIVNKTRLQLITGRSIAEINDWVKQGMPVISAPDSRGGDWEFATAQVFDWHFFRHHGTTSQDKMDLTLERARLARAQTVNQHLKNEVAAGRLIPSEVIESRLTSAIGRCRALLLGIPSASAGQIVLLTKKHADRAERAVRELLLKMVDAALAELVFTRDDDEDEETQAA